jgi:PAS domain S-box-containing protein
MQPPSSRFVLPFAPAAARLTDGIALFVALVGLLVILGWIFDIAELKSIWPNPITMKPLVAVGQLLSGSALWLLNRDGRNPHRQMLGQIFSALVAVLGGLVLLEYLGNVDLDLDRWLFPDAVAAEDVLHPGRPSPSAAYCLFLAGTALIAMDAETRWLAPFLALQIQLFALLALVGHTYDVSTLYQIPPYESIPPHTAASLFALGIGVLSARPERYLAWLISPFAGSVMARNLLPAAGLLPFAIGLIQLKGQRSGLYSTDFGWALFVTFHIVAFSGVIYLAAKLLNKTDAEREIGFAALQEGEERFRLLFQASPNGLLMADLEGKVRLANRQSEALFGYEPGQLQGRALETLLKDPAQDHPYAYREPFTVKLLCKIKGIGSEMIGLRRDGTQFTAQVDGSSLVTREGNMLLVTLVDVTGRKLAEAERDRFVALAEGSTEFIGMCDRNFMPFYVNPAGMQMVGLENLTAACSVRVQDYYFPEDQAFVTDEFFPRVMREGSAEVEIRFRHFQTGEAIWMLCNVFNLRDEKDRISGWATVSRNIHQRKLTEEALKREQSLLVSVMQVTDVMLVFLDTQFNFVWVNAAYAETCGMTPEEMAGKNHFALYPDPENEAIFRQVRDTGKAVFYKDKPFVFPDQPERGTTYWDWSLIPVKNPDGAVTGLVFSLRETTRFKQTQEALIASENRLQLALWASKGGAWDWDLVSGAVTVSDSYRELYGFAPDQPITYNSWLEKIHPDDRERCQIYCEACFQAETEFKLQFRILHPERGLLWLEGIGRVERDAEGRAVRCVGFNLDITERKRVEEALRESEERLRLAWKATRDVIWDWDIVHDTQRWSIAGAEVFGWRDAVEAPQTSRWGLELMHPEDRARVVADLRAVLNDPDCDRWEDEYRFARRDGSYADVFDRGFVMRDGQGKPVRMIGAMQDITERKRAEEKMQELNQALEQQVALRTRELEAINARLKDELAERQLAESRAVASLREKEVLLKEIHHRVKNNLQVVASLLRLQAATLTDPAARDAFLDSQQRIHSMALAHEHIYQSRGLARINMAEYIASLANSIRRSYSYAAQSVELNIQIDDIELDVEQAVPLGLIIGEAVANSFKHAFVPPLADAPGKLWIKLTHEGQDRLTLEIGDNGRGLPDSVDLERPSSMGLHLVQSFVLQLNGQLTVQRQPGTVFSISFPKKKINHA